MGRTMGERGTMLRALAALLLALAMAATWATAAHAATLSGTVTSQTGGDPLQSFAGATVTVSTTGGTPVASTMTGAGGAYSGLTVADGTYDIEVTASGWEAARFEDVALAGSATQDATLVPTGQGRVHGVVRDETGSPIVGAIVLVYGWNTPTPTTTTAADGTFSIAGKQGASVQITGGATGETWALRATNPFVLGRDQGIEAEVPEPTSLTVRVLGVADVPLQGAEVVVPALWRPVQLAPGLSGSISSDPRTSLTDAAGEVELSVMDGGVPRGIGRSIRVSSPGNFYNDAQQSGFTIAGPTLVTFRLTRYAELTFSALDGNGQPQPVYASINGGSWYDNNVWPDPGLDPFTIRVDEGMSVLTARDWNFEFVSDPFHLAGAQTEVLELPDQVHTDITVVDPSGDPVEGAQVRWPVSPVDITSGWIDGAAWVPPITQMTYADGGIRIWHFDGATADPARPGEITPPSASGLAARTFTLADVVSGRVALASR